MSSINNKPVQQRVFRPGVQKNTTTTTSTSTSTASTSTSNKKKSTPNTTMRGKKTIASAVAAGKIKFDEMPGLDLESIYWVTSAPGYGNPLNLNAIPENTGKIFVRWMSWETSDRIGYTLYDKHDTKYWADAASIHMLSQAKLVGIDFDFFNFAVFRERKEFKYGFIPRDYIPREKMVLFKHYKAENQKLVQPGGYIANLIIKSNKTPEPNDVAASTENLPTINEANEGNEGGDIDIFNIN